MCCTQDCAACPSPCYVASFPSHSLAHTFIVTIADVDRELSMFQVPRQEFYVHYLMCPKFKIPPGVLIFPASL